MRKKNNPRQGLIAALLVAGCGSSTSAPAEPPASEQSVLAQARGAQERASQDTPIDSDRIDLKFRSLRGDDSAWHSTLDLRNLHEWASYAILVHTPSHEDDRLYHHEQMIGVLFHPHDQPPGVLFMYSSTAGPLEYSKGFISYQLEAGSTDELQSRYGEFAVLVLDHEGRILIEATEPIWREPVHKVMNYRDGVPNPQDLPTMGPT